MVIFCKDCVDKHKQKDNNDCDGNEEHFYSVKDTLADIYESIKLRSNYQTNIGSYSSYISLSKRGYVNHSDVV